MSEHVDIGQLHIEDRSSGLSCTIDGISFFTPLDDNIQGSSEGSLADRLSSFDAWISTGGSVRLVIEAVLHEHDEHEVFIADIQRDLARLLSQSTVKIFIVEGDQKAIVDNCSLRFGIYLTSHHP